MGVGDHCARVQERVSPDAGGASSPPPLFAPDPAVLSSEGPRGRYPRMSGAPTPCSLAWLRSRPLPSCEKVTLGS